MANTPQQPVETEKSGPLDACEIARRGMAKHGLAVEFTAASQLTSLGWQPSMALMLPGADGVLRDCDILARRCLQPAPEVEPYKRAGALLIECKYVPPNCAWCLLGCKDVHESRAVPAYVPHASWVKTVGTPRRARRSPSQRPSLPVSHGVLEVRADGKGQEDKGYAILGKVVDLAWAFASTLQPSIALKEPAPSFVVPCIVLKGPLVRAVWDDASTDLSYCEVRWGTVLWSGHPAPTRVDIVRLDALGEYSNYIKSVMEGWAAALSRPKSTTPSSPTSPVTSQVAR